MIRTDQFFAAAKAMLVIVMLIISPIYSEGQHIQNTRPDYYDVPMQRMLVIAAGHYMSEVSQGQLDLDSATLMACHFYGLNRLLPYNESFDANAVTAGMQLIDAGDIKAATNLINAQQNDDKMRLLLELGTYYLFKPGADKPDLDSAHHYIDWALSLCGNGPLHKWQEECLRLYGKYYFQAGGVVQSKRYFEAVVRSVVARNDENALAVVLAEQAEYLPFNAPEKLPLLQKSLALCRKHQLKLKEMEVLTSIITIHFSTNWQAAEAGLLVLYKLQKASGYRHLQYIENVLAYLYTQKTDYVTANFFAVQAVKHVNETGDKATSSLHYMRMGDVLLRLNKLPEAEAWYQKSLDGPRDKETQVFWYKSFLSKVRLLVYSEDFKEALQLVKDVSAVFPPNNVFDKMQLTFVNGECYFNLNQPAIAEKYYAQFLAMAEKFPPQYIHNEIPEAYNHIALFYFEQKKYTLSRQFSEKALALSYSAKTKSARGDIYRILFRLDSVDGNYIGAIRNLQLYKSLSDSLVNATQILKYDELLVQYQAEKKDKDIKLLKQNSEIQAVKLRQSGFIRDMTFVGIALLLIIVGLLYYQYRSKQKSNVQLQNQQQLVVEKNETLEQLVVEKEWLLKEIHHRVKNNLHTIVSLLESQSAYLGNDALAAVKDSQHRVFAMSLIHQKLYLTDNVTTINIANYVKELVGYLKDSFDTRSDICFNVHVAPLDLDVAIAIPIGLILNEAITNAIKYAFKNHEQGSVTISMISIDAKHILTIADNGVGLPGNFNETKTNSLGIKLMKGLCKEIDGSFNIMSNEGTIISIIFNANALQQKLQASA